MNGKILISGFGGQGILFTGKFLAYCGMLAGAEVSWLPSYGPEMRGGTANCSVIVSDSLIGSPIVTTPDVLIAMNTPSLDKFEPSVVSGGKIIVDSSLVSKESARSDISFVKIPATSLSEQNELQGIANMIVLGKMLGETNLFSQEVVESAMKKTVSERKKNLFDANLRAIKLGMEY